MPPDAWLPRPDTPCLCPKGTQSSAMANAATEA